MPMTEISKLRPFALLLFVAFTSFVAGCGGDKATSPNTNEFGHYALVSVNGQSLPYTSGAIVIQSASIDLSAATSTSGGKSVYLAGVSGTASGQARQLLADNGTYTLVGPAATFSSAVVPGVQYVGVVSGNALTLTLPGLLFGATGTFTLVMQR